MKFTVKAPGKLVLAGEWAVLMPGNPAIVTAINRKVGLSFEKLESKNFKLSFPDFNIELSGQITHASPGLPQLDFDHEINEEDLEKAKFVLAAIDIFANYYQIDSGFNLTTDSSETQSYLTKNSSKLGFGSSAGITVCTISALLKAFAYTDISEADSTELCYNLSYLAHTKAQGGYGSGFDLASAIYGGVISYSRPNPNFFVENKSNLLAKTWDDLEISTLDFPKDLELLVIFSGESASTSVLLNRFYNLSNEIINSVEKIFDKIKLNTTKLVDAFKKADSKKIVKLLNQNQVLLYTLSERTELNIVTPNLKKISDIGLRNKAAGKLSGAGGGDCGIIVTEQNQLEKIKLELDKEQDLELVGIDICPDGVMLSE